MPRTMIFWDFVVSLKILANTGITLVVFKITNVVAIEKSAKTMERLRIGFLSGLDLGQEADPRVHCFSQTLTFLNLQKENS